MVDYIFTFLLCSIVLLMSHNKINSVKMLTINILVPLYHYIVSECLNPAFDCGSK